jgi:hypothetical protein
LSKPAALAPNPAALAATGASALIGGFDTDAVADLAAFVIGAHTVLAGCLFAVHPEQPSRRCADSTEPVCFSMFHHG